MIANKRRWTEFETVALTEECSSRVRSKIPPKLKDLGSFTISITIGNIEVGLALCDLGLGEPRPTTITLQLADRFFAYLDGIIEDVLIKVGPFILPVDFIVLDYEGWEDVHDSADGQEATLMRVKLPIFHPIRGVEDDYRGGARAH
ncbi:uncharacterized protein LOC132048940 [Lycium ferocissimum]|uniref:uncharacterized protein LOC132048940 n=1 Tax=Lycium ferocissimum TaxID=112874 RepID=UPI0028159A9A|nr:uncharacterized protein LOC132048940 [Lycium ferocissimum]